MSFPLFIDCRYPSTTFFLTTMRPIILIVLMGHRLVPHGPSRRILSGVELPVINPKRGVAKSLRTTINSEVMETVTEEMAVMELPPHLREGVTRTRDDVGSVLTILHTPRYTGFHISRTVLQGTWSTQTNGGKSLIICSLLWLPHNKSSHITGSISIRTIPLKRKPSTWRRIRDSMPT